MNPTFHQRCASALTHPVTIAALAVLLVNDLVFKALWSNPWTTGKLSDLAWVIFASPLLAFILSFPARRSQLAQRAAFITAYIGLPLLYAAYNTFEPLHELIISALLLASGASIGSPFDPTDSLVIPIGLAIAFWTWKRPTAPSKSMRIRLALLAAGLAAFATVATSPAPGPSGEVGRLNDDTLVIDSSELYISTDGGLTWRSASREESLDWQSIQWGTHEVETPRGTYTVAHDNINFAIYRATGGQSVRVFYSVYPQDEASKRFQYHINSRFYDCSHECLDVTCSNLCPPSPFNVVYDTRSGNIVVAAGVQGVVVGDANGNWMPVPMGEFRPTDYSPTNKMRVVLSDWLIWWVATSLSISTIFAAIVASQIGVGMRLKDLAFSAMIAFLVVIGVPLIAVSNIGALFYFGQENLGSLLIGPYVLLFVISQPVALVIGTYLSFRSRNARTVTCLITCMYSIIASCLMMVTLFSDISFPFVETHSGATYYLFMGCLTISLSASILVHFRLQRHQFLIALLTLIGMIALIVLSFMVGVSQDFNLNAAKFYAFTLTLIASFTLWLYLRRRQTSPQHTDE